MALALLFSTMLVMARNCELPASAKDERPDWLTPTDAGSASQQWVQAVGVSTAERTPLADAIGAARVQASRALAERIRVSIKAAMVIKESRSSEKGKDMLQASVESVAESTTEVTLQNLVFDRQWFDQDKCLVWVRAALRTADFERARSTETARASARQIELLLVQADDAGQTLVDREAAMDTALALLQSTDFSPLPELAPSAVKLRITAARQKLEADKRQSLTRVDQLRAHSQAYAEMAVAANPSARRSAAISALRLLRQATEGMSPAESRGLSFDAAQRELALLMEAAFVCQAKALLQKSPAMETQMAAAALQRVRDQHCGPTEVAKERAGEFLAGMPITLACAARISTQIRQWDKACSEVSSYLAAEGAAVTQITPKDEKTFLQLERAAYAPKDSKDASGTRGHTFVLLADGKVNAKTDPELGAKAYRYEGRIVGVVNGRQVSFMDAYDGITGWNPVSEGMALDVLALSASKRLITRFQDVWAR